MATRSGAQPSRAETLAHQEFVRSRPTSRLLDRIADNWLALVLAAPQGDARRYGELSRAVPDASQKMLTQAPRLLERDGLVARAVTPSVPVRVDYRLTELGRSPLAVVAVVNHWAEGHIDEVDAARERRTRSDGPTRRTRRDGRADRTRASR